MKTVIDVSKFQGKVDWAKVKTQVDGAIIRLGYSGYASGKIIKDSTTEINVQECTALNIPFGVYFFPCSINKSEAQAEAKWILNQVSDYKLSLPIFLDSEVADVTNKSGRADKLSKQLRTDLLVTILNELQANGYAVGVYASTAWFNSNLDVSKFPKNTKLWVAQYASKCKYKGTHTAWQYTSSAKISGVSTKCDLSYYYEDFTAKTELEPAKEEQQKEEYNMPTIKKGCKSKAVKIWQIIIGVEADGIFGANTERKTIEWQAQHGLTKDGIVGSKTWKAGMDTLWQAV